jgi:ABC-type uncharacterized transport system permease subunit
MLIVLPDVAVLHGAVSTRLTQNTFVVGVGLTMIEAAISPLIIFEPTVFPVPH